MDEPAIDISDIEEVEPDTEVPEVDVAPRLRARRDELLQYTADVFARIGWRVRTTADLAEDGSLTVRVEPSSIQGYRYSLGFSQWRLLAGHQGDNRHEIAELPRAMIRDIFESETSSLIWLSPPKP